MTDTATLPEPARAFLDGSAKALWIDNGWVDATSGHELRVRDPSNGSPLGAAQEAGAADVDGAVASARAAFEGPWSRLTPDDRGRLLWRMGEVALAHAEELATIETLNNGKTIASSRDDVEWIAATFRYYAGWTTKLYGQTATPSYGNFLAYTRHEPIGVCAGIVPWNYPLGQAVLQIAPALACGNTIVVKPAEQTPLSMLRFAELMAEAGLPDGVLNVVNGRGEVTGQALVDHPGVDKVAFTGSLEVGKIIVRASASNLKRVSLELGGKSPNVFFEDAPEDRVEGATWGIFANMGQDCTAGSRLYVHKAIYDEVVEGVVAAAGRIKLGPGIDEANDLGPLVTREQYDRVLGYVELGRAEGTIAAGGGPADLPGLEQGNFVLPTVVTDTSDDARVAREEIFGPVVVAMPFGDEDELVRKANDTEFGLAAAVWTRDVKRAHRVAHRLRAGSVWVNCYGEGDPALPFGGYKQSGHGRELGQYALDLYTEVKTVYSKLD